MNNDLEPMTAMLEPGNLRGKHTDVAPTLSPSRVDGPRTLWNLPSGMHCSVIGTCLTVRELRRLARRINLAGHATMSDYAIHGAMVSLCASADYPGRLIHKHLERKHRLCVKRFARATNCNELAELWHDAVAHGSVDGAYWALVTHAKATKSLLEHAFAEIHMLGHAMVELHTQQRRERVRLRGRIEDLEASIDSSRNAHHRKLAQKDEDIARLQQSLTQRACHSRAHLAPTDLPQAFTHEPRRAMSRQIERLSAKLEEAEAREQRVRLRVTTLKHRVAQMEAEAETLNRKLRTADMERDALEKTLAETLSGQNAPADPCHLDGRCILYVGGRSRQSPHFRKLVERQHGQFIYHDGGQSDGRSRLTELLLQADVVFCPLDCVGHDAVNRVKKHCKSHAAAMRFLPNSSLTAFARGLHDLT
ncbi:MAG: DUF2325 domain-containing protein [Gammaproteobacteria bacterium]|nr:DUF2325 domain-containing protein [Gammaproteobacteria bacterium]